MTGEGELQTSPSLGESKGLCLQISVTLLLVPPTSPALRTGLPSVYPTHLEGEEAESAAAAEGAVWRESSPSVYLPVCLGFQEILPGGGRSVQTFLSVSTPQVAQEIGWNFNRAGPFLGVPYRFLTNLLFLSSVYPG